MMNRQIVYIVLIFVLLTSCKSENKNIDTVDEVEVGQEDATISSIGITLSPKAKQELDTWLSYQMIQSKINGYYSVTKSQALQNARELADLVRNASDSIKIEKLDRPDLKIRFNVLRNHALRLDDMSTINKISEEDVMTEVASVLDAFSSVNEKINVIYKIEEYEDELDIDSDEPTVFDVKTTSSSKNKTWKNKTDKNDFPLNKKRRERVQQKKVIKKEVEKKEVQKNNKNSFPLLNPSDLKKKKSLK